MAYKDLREFIEDLESKGLLKRIKTEVDPELEITEITDRVSKMKGEKNVALLFENVKGSKMPVLMNAFGSYERMAMALGVEKLDDVADELREMMKLPYVSLQNKMSVVTMIPMIKRAINFPKYVKHAPCQEVVETENPNLDEIPILKCWPDDGGPFVTLPLVFTKNPTTGKRNVGMYRMQVFDDHTTGMHWHIHKTGARHYDAWKRSGRRMPVSVALGGDPAYTYAATAPMPDNMDEYLLAGFLRRRPVKLVKCITNDIYVPADCDFVIEGYVDPSEPKTVEGPFGDHTGFYSLTDEYPRFHVTAVTRRRDAVYPATLVGIPPQEDAYIAKATEKIFLAPIRLAVQPEVKELTMPVFGTAHNLAVVSIDRRYRGTSP